AQGAFRDVLAMGWFQRVRLFLSAPDADTVEKMVLAGFQSFTPSQAYVAVRDGLDILPITIDQGWLDSFIVRPWARRIIKRNWVVIRYLLVGHANDPMSGPPGILGRMIRSGSWLASVFSAPAGWAWLCWTCADLARYLKTYSGVEDDEPISDPPMPDPIRHGVAPPVEPKS
ncbi:MAG: hypothetical protein ACREB9_03765, partial [Thermoplasmata archaeon]